MGKREIIYLSLHCHHQNDFCIKMGSDESHFNVSAGSDGQSHKTASTNHNLSKEAVVFQTVDIYIYLPMSAVWTEMKERPEVTRDGNSRGAKRLTTPTLPLL